MVKIRIGAEASHFGFMIATFAVLPRCIRNLHPGVVVVFPTVPFDAKGNGSARSKGLGNSDRV